MKIVFVSDSIYPYFKGGKEKRLYEISSRLAEKGHDVHIYTMHWWQSAEDSRIESGINLHAISKYYPMYSGERRSIKEGLLFGLACFKLFYIQFDILDVDHMPFFPIFSSWIICKLRGKKLFGTWHEALSIQDWVNYMGKSGLIASAIEKASIKLPDHITAASTRTFKQLGIYHGRTKRLSIVSSGIDLSQLANVKPIRLNCDVLYAGRLVKDKNIDVLVSAIKILVEARPKIKCIIIGDGPERKHLEKLAKEYSLQHSIKFLDPIPKAEDVYSYMKAAKVFCLPSVREGFGIVALEALGCGTPVVTVDARANATTDLIRNDQNGSIVSLAPLDLAGAIDRLLSKPKNKEIAKQVAGFDWNVLASQQEKVYLS